MNARTLDTLHQSSPNVTLCAMKMKCMVLLIIAFHQKIVTVWGKTQHMQTGTGPPHDKYP
jgi:hypothetical protein